MPERTEQCFIHTPSEIVQIIERRIRECEINSQTPFFVAVRGQLGTIPASKYSIYYGVPLKDPTGESIAMDIPKSLVANLSAYQHKEVIVWGFIKSKLFNNSLSFVISVTRIEPVTELSQEVREQEATLMDFLKTHQRDIRPFPNLQQYRIAVIHGRTSEVRDDFERQLRGDGGDLIETVYHPVNINSADNIKQAVESVDTGIVVVIRGGGDTTQLEVFNDYSLVDTWVKKDAYKIAAIGHTANRTLFDTFASQSCDTPTEAGAFVRRNIDFLKSVKRQEDLALEHKKHIEEILKGHAKEKELIQVAYTKEPLAKVF